MQGKAGQRVRQRQLRQHGGGAQYGRCCRKAAQRRAYRAHEIGCAPSRVDATLMPAEASETNTI